MSRGDVAAPLDGTSWRLSGYAVSAGNLVEVPAEVAATATFADGTIHGSTGCNRYHGTCLAADGSLRVTGVAMTMMACGEPETAVERAFTAALEAVATYRIDGDALELADADGHVLLRFGVATAPALIGTRWIATMINNGRGGVVSIVEGTAVDIVLADDGGVSGSGGCNRYHGSYVLDGAALAFGPLASTLLLCASPDGVSEQETAYFGALARVTTWTVPEDRLEFRAADGALQVQFRAAGVE